MLERPYGKFVIFFFLLGCYVTVGVSIVDNFAEYITQSINESGNAECL